MLKLYIENNIVKLVKDEQTIWFNIDNFKDESKQYLKNLLNEFVRELNS